MVQVMDFDLSLSHPLFSLTYFIINRSVDLYQAGKGIAQRGGGTPGARDVGWVELWVPMGVTNHQKGEDQVYSFAYLCWGWWCCRLMVFRRGTGPVLPWLIFLHTWQEIWGTWPKDGRFQVLAFFLFFLREFLSFPSSKGLGLGFGRLIKGPQSFT